MKQHG